MLTFENKEEKLCFKDIDYLFSGFAVSEESDWIERRVKSVELSTAWLLVSLFGGIKNVNKWDLMWFLMDFPLENHLPQIPHTLLFFAIVAGNRIMHLV